MVRPAAVEERVNPVAAPHEVGAQMDWLGVPVRVDVPNHLVHVARDLVCWRRDVVRARDRNGPVPELPRVGVNLVGGEPVKLKNRRHREGERTAGERRVRFLANGIELKETVPRFERVDLVVRAEPLVRHGPKPSLRFVMQYSGARSRPCRRTGQRFTRYVLRLLVPPAARPVLSSTANQPR